jgi:hypothetical protein
MSQAIGPCRDFIRAFLVHPWGINLRNLIWHGFVAATELPRPYVALTLLFIASLSERVESIEGFQKQKLPPLRCGNLYRSDKTIDVGADQFNKLLVGNPMCPRGYEIHLQSAHSRMCQSQPKEAQLEALALVCVTLEHALRCAYCALNQLPQLLLSADSTVLYTTLDCFVAPTLPDGQHNRLLDYLGVTIIVALLDLFHLPRGPRLRDRASHGEVRSSSLAESGAVFELLHLYEAILAGARDRGLRGPLEERLCLEYSAYVSLCHPKPNAANMVARFHRQWCGVYRTLDVLHDPDWTANPPPIRLDEDTLLLAGKVHVPAPGIPLSETECETIRDLCRRRFREQKGTTEAQYAQLSLHANQALGKDWRAFDEKNRFMFSIGRLVDFDTGTSSDNLAGRIFAVAESCAQTLASLHVNVF